MLTDYHNHCLPRMDDGARDVETTIRIVNELERQGVGRIVATPHFINHEESVESFLERRERAFGELLENCTLLPMMLGAEVRLERGISETEGLTELAVGDSGYVLLELPYMPFRSWMIEEIYNVAYSNRLKPVIAHLDRYLAWYGNDEIGEVLAIDDAIIQINNEALIKRKSMKFALGLIRDGYPVVFGSDTHDMDEYAPNADVMLKVLRSKLSKREYEAVMELNESLL